MFVRPINPIFISQDFLDPEAPARFPSHGWAVNTQNRRVLWMPLLPLVLSPWKRRAELGLHDTSPLDKPFSAASENTVFLHPKDARNLGTDSEVSLLAGPPSAEPLRASLTMLVLAAGKLNGIVRQISDLPAEFSADRQTYVDEMKDTAALLIKSAFVELRIFLDLLAFHLVPLLWADWRQDRVDTYPKLLQRVLESKPKESEEFVAPADALKQTLQRSNSWFGLLRARTGGHEGIRDRLLHFNCRILTSVSRADPGHWQLYASLQPASLDHENDLLATLGRLLAGLCALCGDLLLVCGNRSSYIKGDCFSVFMDDRDQTAFWPPLTAADAGATHPVAQGR